MDAMTNKIVDVLQLLTLRYGCIHSRLANAIGNTKWQPIDLVLYYCGGNCIICHGVFEEEFLPVDVHYLQLYFTNVVIPAGKLTLEEAVDRLWKNKEIICGLFRKGKTIVRKKFAERFILQCVACGLLSLNTSIQDKNEVTVSIRDGNDLVPKYLCTDIMIGMALLPSARHSSSQIMSPVLTHFGVLDSNKRIRLA